MPSIVVLEDGADPVAAAKSLGVKPTHIYRYAFSGFSADLPAASLVTARSRSSVRRIDPDGAVEIQGIVNQTRSVSPAAQQASTGYSRIGTTALTSPQDFSNIDVAILDTGVSRHRDLNIAGGYSCVAAGKVGKNGKARLLRPTSDINGHGTHVAGIVGAKDNDLDTIGIAPNASIWAVRVLEGYGTGKWSDVVCGLDWVARHADTIDVVNMSLGGSGRAGNTCRDSALRKAICKLVEDFNIPVVVAASNNHADASGYIPAAFPEATVVSAFADTNGLIQPASGAWCDGNQDDRFADISNYGEPVDIAAPGVCILSLWKHDGMATLTGTSMASPHVTGAIARYRSDHPDATSPEIDAWLQSGSGSRDQASPEGFIGDPDEFPERVLYILP